MDKSYRDYEKDQQGYGSNIADSRPTNKRINKRLSLGNKGRHKDKRPQKYMPQGHEVLLDRAKRTGEKVEITMLDGDVDTWIVTHYDKYRVTATVLNGYAEQYETHVIYKHAIKSIGFENKQFEVVENKD